MSFLKSYYSSVSSYLIGEENSENPESKKLENEVLEETKSDITDDKEIKEKVIESDVKESKSDGWLSGFYNGAYNQSGELWQAVRHDLSEFATVLSNDAKFVASKTAEGVKSGLKALDNAVEQGEDKNGDYVISGDKLKKGFNKILDGLSNVLYIPFDEDFYNDNSDETARISRNIEARLEVIQQDVATFKTDPSSDEENADLGQYSEWKSKLEIDEFQTTIGELIKTNNHLFDQYAELVPRQVSHQDFWTRYFYRVAAIKAEELKKNSLESLKASDEQEEVKSDVNPLGETTVEKKYENSDESKQAEDFKIKEKDDVIFIQHTLEVSSGSEEAEQDNIQNKMERRSQTPTLTNEAVIKPSDKTLQPSVTSAPQKEEEEFADAVDGWDETNDDDINDKWDDWS